MSEIIQKTPEEIQAQVASYASEKVMVFNDPATIFNNIGDIALGNLGGVVPRLVDAQGYVDYLRSVGGSRGESIQGRKDMLSAYSDFAPAVEKLTRDLGYTGAKENNSQFLGSGSSSNVFSVDKDGVRYAVRVPKGRSKNPKLIDSHIAGAILGKGVPGLEQIVAASYEEGVTVAEVIPGKDINKLSIAEVEAITDTHLSGLIDTVIIATNRGISIDTAGANFLYDPKTGFGIVDYTPATKLDKTPGLGLVLGVGVAGKLINTGLATISQNSDKTPEDYAIALDYLKANLGLLKRYNLVVQKKLSGEYLANATTSINEHIMRAEKQIENYSNPEWVSDNLLARDTYITINADILTLNP